jgi:hypothetical protein
MALLECTPSRGAAPDAAVGVPFAGCAVFGPVGISRGLLPECRRRPVIVVGAGLVARLGASGHSWDSATLISTYTALATPNEIELASYAKYNQHEADNSKWMENFSKRALRLFRAKA